MLSPSLSPFSGRVRDADAARLALCLTVAPAEHDDGEARAHCLLDRFSRMPLAEWLRIGLSISSDRAGLARRMLVGAVLKATIRESQLHFAAWRIRDDTDTLFFLVSHSTRHLSGAQARLLVIAKRAAREAALAELAADCVSPADLQVLREKLSG